MTDLVRINGDYGIGLPVELADGTRFIAPAMVPIDAAGAASSGGANGATNSVQLASNIPLAAGAASTPVSGVPGRVYVWDAQWTGTGSLVLEALGADGATYRTVATLAAPGTFAGEIRIGANATLRVRNSSANAYTAVSSVIS